MVLDPYEQGKAIFKQEKNFLDNCQCGDNVYGWYYRKWFLLWILTGHH